MYVHLSLYTTQHICLNICWRDQGLSVRQGTVHYTKQADVCDIRMHTYVRTVRIGLLNFELKYLYLQ